MNKTIYLKDDEGPIWERARELASDKLSPVIVAALKDFIAAKESEEVEAKGFERIVITFNDSDDHNLPKAKAFYGKWIIPITESFQTGAFPSGDEKCAAVAVTSKGRVVVFLWAHDRQEGGRYAQEFHVYPTLELAATDSNVNYVVRVAIERIGVPVEELDI
jgi:hypothetical protein